MPDIFIFTYVRFCDICGIICFIWKNLCNQITLIVSKRNYQCNWVTRFYTGDMSIN